MMDPHYPATPPAEHPAALPLLIDPRGGDTPVWGSDAAGHVADAVRPPVGEDSGHQPGVVSAPAPIWADGIVITVPMHRIVTSRHRARHPSTARNLAPLMESLRVPGRVLPPCPAIVLDDGHTFELLDGHRLIDAGRALGWQEASLLLVSVTTVQAALWTILSDSHRRRYTWWEKVTSMRVLSAVASGPMTGREIARLSGWPESTVSEARTAAMVLTPDVLVLAGVDEVRDRDRLTRLRRRDGRYIVDGDTPEEVALRLREALDGRTPEARAPSEEEEHAASAVSSVLHTDGLWRVEVALREITRADLRSVRRELLRRLDEAHDRLQRAPVEQDEADEGWPAGGRGIGVRQ